MTANRKQKLDVTLKVLALAVSDDPADTVSRFALADRYEELEDDAQARLHWWIATDGLYVIERLLAQQELSERRRDLTILRWALDAMNHPWAPFIAGNTMTYTAGEANPDYCFCGVRQLPPENGSRWVASYGWGSHTQEFGGFLTREDALLAAWSKMRFSGFTTEIKPTPIAGRMAFPWI